MRDNMNNTMKKNLLFLSFITTSFVFSVMMASNARGDCPDQWVWCYAQGNNPVDTDLKIGTCGKGLTCTFCNDADRKKAEDECKKHGPQFQPMLKLWK